MGTGCGGGLELGRMERIPDASSNAERTSVELAPAPPASRLLSQ